MSRSTPAVATNPVGERAISEDKPGEAVYIAPPVIESKEES